MRLSSIGRIGKVSNGTEGMFESAVVLVKEVDI